MNIENGKPYHFQEPNNGAHRIVHPVFCDGVLVDKYAGWAGGRQLLFQCDKTGTYYWRTADSVTEYTGVKGTAFENIKTAVVKEPA